MRQPFLVILLCTLSVFAKSQKREALTNPLYRYMHPTTALRVMAQNEQNSQTKTNAINERLIGASTVYSDGIDSFHYYYTGDHGCTLDFKTNKGYFPGSSFFGQEQLNNLYSGGRKKWMLNDSTLRFSIGSFYNTQTWEYFRYTTNLNISEAVLYTVNPDTPVVEPSDSVIISYDALDRPIVAERHINWHPWQHVASSFFWYDGLGRVIKDSLEGGWTTVNDYSYNPAGFITSVISREKHFTYYPLVLSGISISVYDAEFRVIANHIYKGTGILDYEDSLHYSSGNFPDYYEVHKPGLLYKTKYFIGSNGGN